ncbi:tuberin isoform X1 [Ixodes scapularis]|uniref:tuberin isoform X1 n=1 Tax=Ixodes scapularis TaxID=6945 RepID=UPI001A9E2AD9|nr:tuberin isoform X1 [Ixodes scapularis]
MSKTSREKEKPLERLKSLFGLGKGGSSSGPGFAVPKIEEFAITPEIVRDIGNESSISHRTKSIKELVDIVRTKRLQEGVPETLYTQTCDLLHPAHGQDVRHTVLYFYCCLIQGQFERLDISRTHFFNLIQDLRHPEDLALRLDLLKVLTDKGKCLSHFEDKAPQFLLQWMPEVLSAGRAFDFLSLLINVIKFNSSFLDKEVVAGFVQNTCILCCRTNSESDVRLGLEVLDSVVGYSLLSSEVLPHLVPTLCRTVVLAKLSEPSWRTMRNLQGTHLGHNVISYLCRILEDRANYRDYTLLKGAVFFVGAALWSHKAVPTLKHTPAAVLPSIYRALDCKHPSVAYEAAVALQWLIGDPPKPITPFVWKFVLDVLEKLVCLPEVEQASASSQQLQQMVHDIVSKVEKSYDEGTYKGCPQRLFNIVAKCASLRPEASLQRLIQYCAEKAQVPTLNWVTNLSEILEKYFKAEPRPSVRLYTLNVVSSVLSNNRHLYEEELMKKVLLPHLGALETDPDPAVVTAAVQLLTDFFQDSGSQQNNEVLDIIEKVLNHPTWSTKPNGAEEVLPVETAARGLIDVFRKKMWLSPQCAVATFRLLVDHVRRQYRQDPCQLLAPVRLVIMKFLVSLRTNALYQIGMDEGSEEGIRYSPHLLCPFREGSAMKQCSPASAITNSGVVAASAQPHIAHLGVTEVFDTIIASIREESDWPVLSTVLQGLPGLLKDKALVLSGQMSFRALCVRLRNQANERNRKPLDQMHRVPAGVTASDLNALLYPAMGAMTMYRTELDSSSMCMVIHMLEHGLASKQACVCLRALVLATLEMRDAMGKLLPEVLQRLAQVSATLAVAVPVLEFLSNLIRIPQLYVSFVEEQYRKIFAIALPYTNPVKFNRFVVALAHHVIAMWFLKCRITFRKDLVPYVIKNLKNNLELHVEDGGMEDTTQRKRSSSLNEPMAVAAASRSRSEVRHSVASVSYASGSGSSSDMVKLQEELLETFVDLMSQYCFGTCSSQPHRSATSEFMLKQGRSMTWLLGHKMVTITTSGCGGRAYRLGMCERCYCFCRDAQDQPDPCQEGLRPASEVPLAGFPSEEQQGQNRRRHQSEADGRSSLSGAGAFASRMLSGTKDDLSLRQVFPDKRAGMGGDSEPGDGRGGGVRLGGAHGSSHVSGSTSGEVLSHVCSCWCCGWAEVYVRRPTGNTSWVMRLQNDMFSKTCTPDFPLPDVSAIFRQPQMMAQDWAGPPEEPVVCKRDRRPSEGGRVRSAGSSEDISPSAPLERSGSPLRRTNSSPEVPAQRPPGDGCKTASPGSAPQSPSAIFDRLDEEGARLALRKSPRKDDRYDCIPEESHWGLRAPPFSKARLKLDLSPSAMSEPPVGPATSLHSPPPLSRLQSLQGRPNDGSSPTPASSYRDRGHTVSGISPVTHQATTPTVSYIDMYRCGMNPRFVFLHLYHNSFFGKPGTDEPIPVPESKWDRSSNSGNALDFVPTYETHKIGVVYVGPGQAQSETAMLSNRSGSERYTRFLLGLGRTVCLRDLDTKATYTGGLDVRGADGKYSISWQDDIMQVIFHVATLMPNKENDRQRSDKKRHIGNDYVMVLYNDSSESCDRETFRGEFHHAFVIIEPWKLGNNLVTLEGKAEVMELFRHSEPQVVPDSSLSLYVRQLALHANIACNIVLQKTKGPDLFVNNWHGRLRHINLIRQRLLDARAKGESTDPPAATEDFTRYL